MPTAVRGQSGRFSTLLYCFLALSPSLVAIGLPAAPRLAPWLLGAIVRWYFGDRRLVLDCALFGGLTAYLARVGLREALTRVLEGCNQSHMEGLWFPVFGFGIPFALLTRVWWQYANTQGPKQQRHEGSIKWELDYPKPRIFPCQTKHARLFPQRHAFDYSYLQVGFPVIPAGLTADGEAFGDGSDRRLGSWWLRIHADDYLGRGDGDAGFYGKLKQYLAEHRVQSSDWSYAYLVTAPRFFGYAFNPVSFWYIYDVDHQLKKMILEVNNTFGERRLYLLDGSNVVNPNSTGDSEIPETEVPLGAKSRFTDRWVKDFHVSPFNSRKGSYVLKAQNPFPVVTHDSPVVDNTITLISSKDHAKLVARLSSTGPAIELSRLGVLGASRIILSWWWIGFMTFPRIVKEAFKLFFKRKLHVWFRPEVLSSSIGRAPTSTEIELYKAFSDYLSAVVHSSSEPFYVSFDPAIPGEQVQKIETPQTPIHTRGVRRLEIRILTPAFYSRFVHYAHTSEAFDRESIFTDEKNRTVWISRPELLPILFQRPCSPTMDPSSNTQRTYLDKIRWNILRRLRCAPVEPAYSVSTPSKAEYMLEDVRSLPFSELDLHARNTFGAEFAANYRRTVTKLFMAQRIGLGFAEAIGLLDILIRLVLCSLAAFPINALRTRTGHTGNHGCAAKSLSSRQLGACSPGNGEPRETWWNLAGSAVLLSACHLYEMSKGYN
ncbi:hypothetical protein FB567DRAFT_180333 [Paraphoma chrysanthemicola]|uniref:DUF1365-domain-containing protein n=1 Tax=Paraphoma chrysanthemicola TaxID=798071 RepID=A0A8K0RIW2_9PLEO|nr:hypothetical protein FB567DRAFT_180333 [Paraphoma chrysanthemicola]